MNHELTRMGTNYYVKKKFLTPLVFSAFVEKRRGERVRLRMAGDGDRLGGSAESEPALKPERPEATEKASEGRFRRKRASGAVLGLAMEDMCWVCEGSGVTPKKSKSQKNTPPDTFNYSTNKNNTIIIHRYCPIVEF